MMSTTKGEPAGINPVKLRRRVTTALILGVIAISCFLLGNRYFALPALLIVGAMLGADEFYRIASPNMAKVPRAIGIGLAVSLPIITYVVRLHVTESPLFGSGGLGVALTALFYSILAGLLCYLAWVATTPTSHIRDAAIGFFGALYLGIPLSCLILIREMNDHSPVLALTLALSVWVGDSFAYLGGSLFGRHKLAPIISPKKSWEGLLFAVLGSILCWYFIPLVWTGGSSSLTVPAAGIIGTITALTALLGDLFESRIKRDAGVKDSGKLLPGHGGILDRIDSFLFTVALLFLLLSTVGVALGVVIP